MDRERRREIREQRRLAALRRTESGTSVSTLPVYNPTPADEEQILLKRLETDTLSLAPTYDDTPWPEHPPTWSEIHGSGHGHRTMSPAQMSPTSPTSPSSFRSGRGARSVPGSFAVHSQLSHAHSTHSAPVRSPSKSPTKSPSKSPEKYPVRPSSAASSTWSVSTSSDEEEEVHTSRARRIIGESSAKLLGNSSLRRHLQRNASFRLSPANSRMSSIRSVFTARTHQPSHQHGESTSALLPTQETEEVLTDAASGVSGSNAGRSPGGSRMSRNSSRSSLRESVLGVVGVLPRVEGQVERSESERRPEMGRSISQGESMRKKLARKATA